MKKPQNVNISNIGTYNNVMNSAIVTRHVSKLIISFILLSASICVASATPIYVATDGTGDYICDGIDDHIEINWALDNASSGDVVHINASTYWINDSLWINNTDTILEGDGDISILKLPTSLSWAQFKRMTYINANNITIQNIRFDGNGFNQTAPRGANYHVIIEILATHYNIAIRNCTIKDTRDDGIIPSDTHNLVVDGCYLWNVDHGGVEGSYYDSIISNNIVEQTGPSGLNAGFRLYYGSGNNFNNNTIKQSTLIAHGFEIHAYNNNDLSGNTFEDNVVEGVFTKAFHFDAAASSTDLNTMRDITIRNNIVGGVEWEHASYGQGIYVEGLWNNWAIENNVIYGARCGIEEDDTYPTAGNIVLKNNIISGNREYGIQTDTSNLILSYNDVWGNAIANYNGISEGIGDISADPLFADPINHDFHLRSEYGRYDSATWVNDDVTSPCIGAGEPKPDGTRTNLGAYRNSIEASKGASDVTPLVTNLRNDQPAQNTVTLRWNCSEPDVDHYTIHKDGALLETTGNKYYSANNLAPDTMYTFEVSATNKDSITGDSVSITARTAAGTSPGLNTFYIADNVTASHGSYVTVPIRILDATGVACDGMNLTYDSSVVIVTSVTQGDFTTYFGFDGESAADGWVTVNTYVSETSLTGDVKIADVTLKAVGDPGDTTPLDMEIIAMTDQNGHPVSGTVSNGLFTVASDTSPPVVTHSSASQLIPDDTDGVPSWGETATLSVTVTDESDIAGVTIDLSTIGGSPVQPMTYIGNNVWSVTTNASAETPPQTYDLTVCATDIHGYTNMQESVELIVMRNGDVTGDNDVTLDDVALLENYVTYPGRYTISSEFVADVSGDGVINIADAMMLANYVANPDQRPIRCVENTC